MGCFEQFENHFKKNVVLGRIVNFQVMKKDFCYIEDPFVSLWWTPLLSIWEVVYEDQVKFYANLRVLKDGVAMKSIVWATTIILDEIILGDLLGMHFSVDIEFFSNTWLEGFPVNYD